MAGVKHVGFAPVFYFHEIHKSIQKTEKWRLSDEIYKKTGEFSKSYGFCDFIYIFVVWVNL
jgi:hypothetical protein